MIFHKVKYGIRKAFTIVFEIRLPISCYKNRWQIETLFKDFKSSEFNIEDTHVMHLDKVRENFYLFLTLFF